MIFRQILSRVLIKNELIRGSLFLPSSRPLRDEAPRGDQTISVRQILEATVDDSGSIAAVKGWISGIRLQKENTFVDIVDGSSFRHLQVVFKTDSVDEASIVYGSAVYVTGRLMPSHHPMQKVELRGDAVTVIGTNVPGEFPIKAKVHKTHDGDYLRNAALTHRHRTHAGASMLKIRNRATMAYHDFFQKKGFLLVNTPILTSNDCEGAGEVFRVVVKGDESLNEEGEPETYFKRDVHLTVSGQLHLEAFVHGLSKVYTFGPTFRADETTSRFHLGEFYMVEAELAFIDSIADLCQLIEELMKETSENVLNTCDEDLELYHKYLAKPKRKKYLKTLLEDKFGNLSYDEAVDMLRKTKDFETVQWGQDFNKDMEKYLVQRVGNKPLFIFDYPSSLKPFYAKGNGDLKTCASFDLLLPEVGEVCGGTLREHDYQTLLQNMKLKGTNVSEENEADNKLKWYADLRKFGSVPHGGFGVGFERHLMFMTGVNNIRNCIPFPRSKGKCLM